MKLENVVLPGDPHGPKDIEVAGGVIRSVRPSSDPSGPPSLLLPALCHPHIHLDKAYILTGGGGGGDPPGPDYADLLPRDGSLAEALRLTALAKERFTAADLRLRGAQLLAESRRHGVASLRAFVEVDRAAGLRGLAAGLALRAEFAPALAVQLCVFAQEPVFSPPHGAANRALALEALDRAGPAAEALGTAPYVEASRAAALRNAEWAVETALARGLHLDLHLDYTLEPPGAGSPPLAHAVVDLLVKHDWPGRARPGRTVALGHCTQLTLLPDAELAALAARIAAARLPVHFVGLPTSDLFMMGRPPAAQAPHPPPAPGGDGGGTRGGESGSGAQARPRGTLQVPSLIRSHGLGACLGVNNVGNAFTPYGAPDPLQLASWGVGLYHAGTPADAALLYGCVSWRARRAVGLEEGGGGGGDDDDDDDAAMTLVEGSRWRPMLLVRNRETLEVPGTDIRVPARQRRSVQDVVWDPPEVSLRRVIY